MKITRFAEEQIIVAIRSQVSGEKTVKKVCRQLGISAAIFCTHSGIHIRKPSGQWLWTNGSRSLVGEPYLKRSVCGLWNPRMSGWKSYRPSALWSWMHAKKLLGPSRRRIIQQALVRDLGLSIRSSCRLAGMSRSHLNQPRLILEDTLRADIRKNLALVSGLLILT
ncbi:MAG: hypothetical protein K0Q50_1960 [Vampirovibrio sp.]|nr:hypothetical protein [Vampirovibrio sp.]